MYETQKKEKALLVLVVLENEAGSWPVDEQALEFKNLVLSTGIEVAALEVVKRKNITPALYIGKGKAQELTEKAQEFSADVVIFNNNLHFTQQRNLEDIIGIKTIDRTQLILDIFSRHAHTQEGSLQVELAQLEYMLPRLKGKGIMLSRLGGGIGTRGPGEKKLEVERRRIADRIVRLKHDIDNVRKYREVQRKKRQKEKLSICSLVGYTSAGKSTLLNRITGEHQKTSESLFTTLDPVSRICTLGNQFKAILSDTVGFIYKLPPQLIEAFKATLEELRYADLLIHVVDVSAANYSRLISAVDTVLKELTLEEKPLLLVCNKIDKLKDFEREKVQRAYPEAVCISALKDINIDLLLEKIKTCLSHDTCELLLKFPFESMEMLDYLYKHAQVLKVEYTPTQVIAWVRVKNSFVAHLKTKPVELQEINP